MGVGYGGVEIKLMNINVHHINTTTVQNLQGTSRCHRTKVIAEIQLLL